MSRFFACERGDAELAGDEEPTNNFLCSHLFLSICFSVRGGVEELLPLQLSDWEPGDDFKRVALCCLKKEKETQNLGRVCVCVCLCVLLLLLGALLGVIFAAVLLYRMTVCCTTELITLLGKTVCCVVLCDKKRETAEGKRQKLFFNNYELVSRGTTFLFLAGDERGREKKIHRVGKFAVAYA